MVFTGVLSTSMHYRTISKIFLAVTVAVSSISASELGKRSSQDNKENEGSLEYGSEGKRERLCIETEPIADDTPSVPEGDDYVKPFDSGAIHEPFNRDAHAIPARGCLKGTNPKGGINLRFAPEVIDATTYDITGVDAETKFFEAMLSNRLSICREMQKQGFRLSASNQVFEGVNMVLRSFGNGTADLIKYLMKYYYHVLSQNYEEGNVFEGISAETANFIIETFPLARSVHIQLFKEVVNNPSLFVSHQLFQVKYQMAREMIDIASAADRHDIARAIIYDADNLTCEGTRACMLFDAIENFDLALIELVVTNRDDGIISVLFKNSEDKNAIDLALDRHNEGDDDDYMVLRSLMNIIGNVRHQPVELVSELFNELLTKCSSIQDDNRDLLAVLGEHLIKLNYVVIKAGPYDLEHLVNQNISKISEIFRESLSVLDK